MRWISRIIIIVDVENLHTRCAGLSTFKLFFMRKGGIEECGEHRVQFCRLSRSARRACVGEEFVEGSQRFGCIGQCNGIRHRNSERRQRRQIKQFWCDSWNMKDDKMLDVLGILKMNVVLD